MTLGPYFVWEPWAVDAGWRPWAELTEPEVVAERVESACRAMTTMFSLPSDAVPVRVIASITFLGWASRLLSPPLGAAVTRGELPVPDPARMWWRPVTGGPLPMAVRDPATVPCGDRPAAWISKNLGIDELVRPVLEVFRREFRLSPKVLWGNVASALAGAAGMVKTERARDIVAACLDQPPLAGAGTLTGQPRRLRRNNCCLYYRIPGGGTCGDCVLRGHPTR